MGGAEASPSGGRSRGADATAALEEGLTAAVRDMALASSRLDRRIHLDLHRSDEPKATVVFQPGSGGGGTSVLRPPWLIVLAPALLATVLHPAGPHFFRSFHVSRADRVLLALLLVAAAPLLVFAATSAGLQASVADDHAAMGHYGFMAALGVTVVALGLLASLRPDGWGFRRGSPVSSRPSSASPRCSTRTRPRAWACHGPSRPSPGVGCSSRWPN